MIDHTCEGARIYIWYIWSKILSKKNEDEDMKESKVMRWYFI